MLEHFPHHHCSYQAWIYVTATAGLGDYEDTNKDSITTPLTSDRVIQRSVLPEFTDHPDVKIENIGVHYHIYRCNGENFNSGWIYDFYNWTQETGDWDGDVVKS